MEPSLSYEREHRSWSLETRSWKPRREGTIDGKPTTRKTPSKTTNSDPTHGDAISSISWNLRKNRSSQYWPDHPTRLWGTTAQLRNHKSDLQQIPDNLTGEEGEEGQEHRAESFLVMVRSTAHRKGKRKCIDGDGSRLKYRERIKKQNFEKNKIHFWRWNRKS